MRRVHNPYGDDPASGRISTVIDSFLNTNSVAVGAEASTYGPLGSAVAQSRLHNESTPIASIPMDYPPAQPITRAIDFADDIATCLSRKLIGQPAAIAAIVPYVQMYRAMLNPEGRPAGV